MSIKLDNDKIMDAVVERIAADFLGLNESDIHERVTAALNKTINDALVERVQPRIEQEIEAALSNVFEKEYHKTNSWGKPEGKPTTISKELERLVKEFWTEKVNTSGKPDQYGKATRAEHAMMKLMAEDFFATLKPMLVTEAAAVKDGLRDAMRGKIDEMLGNVFHVRSGQDQAEGRYK